MHLRSALVFVAVVAAVVATVKTVEVPFADTDEAGPPVKLDKNLRRALLKALADLEAESAEQQKSNEDEEEDVEEGTPMAITPTALPETITNENLEKNPPSRMTYSFNEFLGEGEFPSEEKLQNSTFVEIDKYTFSSPGKQATANEVPAIREESKSQQIHDLVSAEKSSALYLREPLLLSDDVGKDQGTRSIKGPIALVNSVQSVSSKPITQLSESLARSSSSNIVAAAENSLTSPKPTASSLTTKSKNQLKENLSPAPATGSSRPKENLDEKPEVKIFQAPLVAAFTVQQDERGVPKSVVPIYRPNGDGQALTLQEQLEFKQQQLEKQILDLQRQQVQQTQFLARQQQLYEEQLQFKQQQQQEIYLREQVRLKQLEEQRIYQQQIQQQQQQQRLQQASFDQNSLTLQPSFDKPGIQFQPSVSLQLPNIASPPLFQSNYQEQLQLQRLQQRQRQQQQRQQQQQQLQLQQQQQQQQQLQQQQQQQLQLQQQQQRLQQSFGAFPISEFQNPGSRLNRQEVFGSTGNFGFNSNKNFNARGNFGGSQLNAPFRNSQNFGFDGFNQFRQARPQTPARQIQHLLYQSGVASDLGTTRGSGGAEDLNIVSKVLALNVGALPSNSLQFGASKRVNSFAKPPNAA